MENTGFITTIFAALLTTSGVTFGDVSCAKNLTAKSDLKLMFLKNDCVSSDTSKPVGYLENDPRQTLDRNQHPEYNSIGTVQTRLGRGTAWLANECLVVTAKHVLGRNKNVVGQKIKFSVGQSQTTDKDFEYVIDGEVVAAGNPDAKKRNDAGSEDWALIKLKKSIGNKVGFILTAQYSVEDAGTCVTLEVAGFPGEKNVRSLWWQGGCKLFDGKYESDSGGFLVDCPVTPGDSGAPLLCRETDGKLYAIGIMNQQVSYDPSNPNGPRGLAINFTGDIADSGAAFDKYRDTCEQASQKTK